jgi:hypothetical protein
VYACRVWRNASEAVSAAICCTHGGFRESTETRLAFLCDVRVHRIKLTRSKVADGHCGVWRAPAIVEPAADKQYHWTHRAAVAQESPFAPA